MLQTLQSYTGAFSVEKEKAKKSASATRGPFYYSPSVAVQNVRPDVACKIMSLVRGRNSPNVPDIDGTTMTRYTELVSRLVSGSFLCCVNAAQY